MLSVTVSSLARESPPASMLHACAIGEILGAGASCPQDPILDGALNPPLKISLATNAVVASQAMKLMAATVASAWPAAHWGPLQNASSLRNTARAIKPEK